MSSILTAPTSVTSMMPWDFYEKWAHEHPILAFIQVLAFLALVGLCIVQVFQ